MIKTTIINFVHWVSVVAKVGAVKPTKKFVAAKAEPKYKTQKEEKDSDKDVKDDDDIESYSIDEMALDGIPEVYSSDNPYDVYPKLVYLHKLFIEGFCVWIH